MSLATPAPPPQAETISVVSIRPLPSGLVELVFGFSDLTRRRVVLDRRLVTVDNVEWIGRSLPIVVAMREAGR